MKEQARLTGYTRPAAEVMECFLYSTGRNLRYGLNYPLQRGGEAAHEETT